MPSQSNYFIGNDPDRWISGIPHYAQVEYQDVYPGIDLLYHFQRDRIEFDFVIQPGSDPGRIGLSFQGMDRCDIHEDGNLVLSARGRELVYEKPAAWQEMESGRKEVDVRFAVLDHGIGFVLGAYEPDKILTIDPRVVYATYLGGSLSDQATGIAVDAQGNAYITGSTASNDDLQAPGHYTVAWDGKDEYNLAAAADLYICRITAGRYRESRKMLLIR